MRRSTFLFLFFSLMLVLVFSEDYREAHHYNVDVFHIRNTDATLDIEFFYFTVDDFFLTEFFLANDFLKEVSLFPERNRFLREETKLSKADRGFSLVYYSNYWHMLKRLTLLSDEFIVGDGIRIGDSIESILPKMRTIDFEISEIVYDPHDPSISYYVNIYDDFVYISIIFVVKNGKVSEIVFSNEDSVLEALKEGIFFASSSEDISKS